MKNIKEVTCMDISSAKILVVMGGTSSERDISLMSGNAVLEALKGRGLNAEGFVLDAGNAAQILQKNPDCVFIALHGKGGEDGTIQGMQRCLYEQGSLKKNPCGERSSHGTLYQRLAGR